MTRYSVILADPPWQYRAWKGDRGMRTAESFYPTMSAAELHALRPRIDEWAERDCALFLWIRARDVPQVIMAPPREHSRKPDEQYARIERLYGGPYLELFARHRRDGWDVWGDEAQPRVGALPKLPRAPAIMQ